MVENNFKVDEYGVVSRGFLGNSTCPSKFTLITENNDWNTIIKNVVRNINGKKNSGWAAFNYSRLPQNEIVVEKNLAAFVLLEEQKVSSDYDINEAIFVLKKVGSKIDGVLLTVSSKNAGEKNYFRHVLNKIKCRCLYYTYINNEGEHKKRSVKISTLFK